MPQDKNKSEYVKRVLTRLAQPDLSNLGEVLGRIVERRCQRADPACSLLNQLAISADHWLGMWETSCRDYLQFLKERSSGTLKAEDDLLSRASTCNRKEFDQYLGDFNAEMGAVAELGKRRGYSNFEPVLQRVGVKTFDYRAVRSGKPICVEVKHVRAPISIMDVFASALQERYAEEPSRYAFRLILTYYSDNTVTESQRRRIFQFLEQIAGKQVPFTQELILDGDVSVQVKVEAGSGQTMMTRGEGADRWGEVRLSGFVNKIADKTREAIRQFEIEPDRTYVLVFNIDPAPIYISTDFLNAAVNQIAEIAGDSIEWELLVRGEWIAPDPDKN